MPLAESTSVTLRYDDRRLSAGHSRSERSRRGNRLNDENAAARWLKPRRFVHGPGSHIHLSGF